MRNSRLALQALLLVVIMIAPASAATIVYDQGFETDTSGWSAGGSYGTIDRVPSGTGGVASSSGVFHAEVNQSDYGPYTFYGVGPSAVWPNGFTSSLDIFLDVNWGVGTGFDISAAASNSAGGHLRDFITHVAVQNDGTLRVGGSNNTNFNPRMDLASINNAVIAASGWYTFQQIFRDNGGVLAVDLRVLQGNTLLFNETRSTATDLIGVNVGGNRYLWNTNVDGIQNLAIDNVKLVTDTANVPEPSSMVLLGLGLLGTGFVTRRRRQSQR